MKIEKFANALKFDFLKTVFYKQKGGYILSLSSDANEMFYLTVVSNRVITKEDLKVVKGSYKKVRLTSTNIPNDTIIAIMPYSVFYSDKYINKCDDEINNFINGLKEANISQFNKCAVCKEDCEELGMLRGKVVYLHEECGAKLKETLLENVNAELQNNVPRGKSIILSLILAFVGIIPSVIILFGFSYMFALLFALPAFLAFWGYKKGGAKVDGVATGCAIGFSFLSVVFYICLYLVALMGAYECSLGELVTASKGLIISDVVKMLLFYGIGVAITFKYITNTSSKRKKEIEKM